MGDAVKSLVDLDKQVYGTFPAGFGDNGPGEELDDEQGVADGSRPQMEEQVEGQIEVHAEQVPNPHLQADISALSSADFNLRDEIPSILEHPPFLSDLIDFLEALSIPNNMMDASQIATQPILLGEDLSCMDDGYGVPLVSNLDATPNGLAGLSLHQNGYYEFDPDTGFHLPLEGNTANFGYNL